MLFLKMHTSRFKYKTENEKGKMVLKGIMVGKMVTGPWC